jgi:hypothetical protein
MTDGAVNDIAPGKFYFNHYLLLQSLLIAGKLYSGHWNHQSRLRLRLEFSNTHPTSEEFASTLADHTFRVSIMSGQDAYARELYRVVNCNLQWPR